MSEKIILKTDALPGVDMSVVDLTAVHTVKMNITKVTNKLYKINRQTFIGVKEPLDVQDVFQVGDYGIKYRVRKLEKMTDRNGYIYKVKRFDGASTTQLDIDAIRIGQKVRVVSRQTFDQLFNYACSMREEKPIPTTIDTDAGIPCENVAQTYRTDEPIICSTFRITVPIGVEGSTQYIDCNGDNKIIEYPARKFPTEYNICAIKSTTFIFEGPTPTTELTGLC